MNDYKNENMLLFKTMFDSLPLPIFYKDNLGFYRYCNDAFAKYLALEKTQIINKSVYDVAPVDLAEVYETADQNLLMAKGTQVYEAIVKSSDDTYHDVIFTKAVLVDNTDTAIGIIGLIQDVTEQRAIEREVMMLHALKDVFLTLNHQIMAFKDEKELLYLLLTQIQSIFKDCKQGSVLEINDKGMLNVITSYGYEEGDMSNFNMPLNESFIWKDLSGELTQAHIVNDITQYIELGFKDVTMPLSGQPIKSSLIIPIWIDEKLKWIISLDKSENHIYTETDRKVADYIREELPLMYRIFELYLKTLELSRYDSLTKLNNRNYFDEIHGEIYNNALASQTTYAIVLFDLDGLKRVNDLYGHHVGDVYLKVFSKWLKELTLGKSTFARIGGDEFTGLFIDADAEILKNKIAEIRHTFESISITGLPHNFCGSFSFGVASFPNDSASSSKLFQIADARMYEDKRRKLTL